MLSFETQDWKFKINWKIILPNLQDQVSLKLFLLLLSLYWVFPLFSGAFFRQANWRILKFKLKGSQVGSSKSIELHIMLSTPKYQYLTSLFGYLGYLFNIYCFLWAAGIINKRCLKLNQITNRWWISEAVENRCWKTRETWDILCFWKHVMPKVTFSSHDIAFLLLVKKIEISVIIECLNHWVLHEPRCYGQVSCTWFVLICLDVRYNLRMSMFKTWRVIRFVGKSC